MNPHCDEKPPTDSIARLFPLGGTVLFPHGLLPLHIFEPRYRQMTEHALEGDRGITMVLPTHPEAAEPVPIARVGCMGRIMQERRLADGRFKFMLQGMWRVRIVRELPMQFLYRRADFEFLEDHWRSGLSTRRELQRADILRSLRSLLPQENEATRQFVQYLTDRCGPGVFADIVAYAVPVDIIIKQILLEQPDVDARLELLTEELRKIGRSEDDPATGPLPGFPPGFSRN